MPSDWGTVVGKEKGVGQRIHHQHGANSAGGGMWAQALGASKLNPITKSLTLKKFSSKMSLEIEMHECTDAQNPMLARTFDGTGANLLSD